MALKPTIFKFAIALSDTDANLYTDLNLTVAQHPSETGQRMMVRLLAYCINTSEGLEFTKGLSTNDEPDLWLRSLDGRILNWIEVGEPSAERIDKASRVAERVTVYSFNTKSPVWWRQTSRDLKASNLEVFQFEWEEITQLANMLQRTLPLSISISGLSAFVASDTGSVEITWRELVNT